VGCSGQAKKARTPDESGGLKLEADQEGRKLLVKKKHPKEGSYPAKLEFCWKVCKNPGMTKQRKKKRLLETKGPESAKTYGARKRGNGDAVLGWEKKTRNGDAPLRPEKTVCWARNDQRRGPRA